MKVISEPTRAGQILGRNGLYLLKEMTMVLLYNPENEDSYPTQVLSQVRLGGTSRTKGVVLKGGFFNIAAEEFARLCQKFLYHWLEGKHIYIGVADDLAWETPSLYFGRSREHVYHNVACDISSLFSDADYDKYEPGMDPGTYIKKFAAARDGEFWVQIENMSFHEVWRELGWEMK